MRILTLDYEYPPLGGGASPVAARIAAGLSGRGHTVHAVTMGMRGLPSTEDADGVTVERVPALRKRKDISTTPELLSYLISARFRLARLLREEAFDAVHCHFAVPTGPLANWIRKRYGIPYVLTSHGSDIPGHNPQRFKLMHKLVSPLTRNVLRNAASVVAPSQFLLGSILRLDPSLKDRVLHIPNGIDTDAYRPAEKSRIILSTGRLLAFKGFRELVQAVSDMDSDYELHICGDGPLREELERASVRSQMPVVFHGWMDNRSSEYQDLLSRAAIYALPSHRENASVALLEAMSAGCAVITSNVSGCPETVGDSGILLAPGDVKALAAALKKLMHDSSLAEDLGGRARRRVETNFDWNAIVAQYEELLQKTAADSKRVAR